MVGKLVEKPGGGAENLWASRAFSRGGPAVNGDSPEKLDPDASPGETFVISGG